MFNQGVRRGVNSLLLFSSLSSSKRPCGPSPDRHGGSDFIQGKCWAWRGPHRLTMCSPLTAQTKDVRSQPAALRLRPVSVWVKVSPSHPKPGPLLTGPPASPLLSAFGRAADDPGTSQAVNIFIFAATPSQLNSATAPTAGSKRS